MKPKVFISYSWSSKGHQSRIIQWAEQLIADGVDVVLDKYDLKEGQDKFAFMERMVTDLSVTHVLVFCDKVYAEKADARKAGVGTESQIISKEVYEKVDQSKFIPIICELSDTGEPFLPTFFKSRIWIDFSSPEAANENWEHLVRLLYGKPLIEKPKPGKAPAYVADGSDSPSSPAISKFNSLRQAILQGKPAVSIYRRDFLDSCLQFANELRTRERPEVSSLGARVLEDCGKLKCLRNHLVDWVLLESEAAGTDNFTQALIELLEKLRGLKYGANGNNAWQSTWAETQSVFVYEVFLYVVAGLLKTKTFDVLHEIFTSHYLLPTAEQDSESRYDNFGVFYGYSRELQSVLAPEGKRLYSPAAELIKRQADREDIPFDSIIEGELLILMIAFINPSVRWFPQTLYYSQYNKVSPFFIRATQHKYFGNILKVTGVANSSELKRLVKEGAARLNPESWEGFHFHGFLGMMNIDKLDTIK